MAVLNDANLTIQIQKKNVFTLQYLTVNWRAGPGQLATARQTKWRHNYWLPLPGETPPTGHRTYVRGPIVRGPIVRGPIVRGPIVPGPIVRGPMSRQDAQMTS